MQPYEFNDSEVADLNAVAAMISARL